MEFDLLNFKLNLEEIFVRQKSVDQRFYQLNSPTKSILISKQNVERKKRGKDKKNL